MSRIFSLLMAVATSALPARILPGPSWPCAGGPVTTWPRSSEKDISESKEKNRGLRLENRGTIAFFDCTILYPRGVEGLSIAFSQNPHEGHITRAVNGLQEGMDVLKEARLTSGPISLQAHDPTTNLDFRHLRITILPKR